MKKRNLSLAVFVFLILLLCKDINSQENKLFRFVGECNTNPMHAFKIIGDHAYLATHNGLEIISLDNPNNPVKIGELEIGYCMNIDVLGDFAYLVTASNGLIIINVKNKNHPALVSNYSGTGGMYHDVKVTEKYAFVTNNSKGLEIIDIAVPQKPVLVSTFYDEGPFPYVTVKGDLLYLSNYSKGIQIIDISDIESPKEISIIPNTSEALNAIIENDRLYIGSYKGVKIFSLKDARKPTLIKDLKEYNGHITVSSNVLFVLMFNSSVGIDISDIEHHKVIWNSDMNSHAIFFNGRFLYYTNSGIKIFRYVN